MSLDNLKEMMPSYAKDTKLNLSSVLTEAGSPNLTLNQIYGTALACAYTTKNQVLIREILEEVQGTLSPQEIEAVKAATSIMGMNNIYYRFLHMASDKEFSQYPANLRMQVIGNPGIDKKDFELYSLAVSAINGCGMCIDSHVHHLVKEGVHKTGIQSSIRIAAVINAAAQVLTIENANSADSALAA